MRARAGLIGLAFALAVTVGCDGPNEEAGEQADAASGAVPGAVGAGPQERLGEIRDRTERDQGRAVEAQADAAEDRADELRSAADQRADTLEQEAAAIRNQADQAGTALDQQADRIRGK